MKQQPVPQTPLLDLRPESSVFGMRLELRLPLDFFTPLAPLSVKLCVLFTNRPRRTDVRRWWCLSEASFCGFYDRVKFDRGFGMCVDKRLGSVRICFVF